MKHKAHQNTAGYVDLTAYTAISNITREERYCASEAQEQAALFEWAKLNEKRYPALKLMYAIPNGECRPITTARKLKTQGVKPGVPDICLPVPRRGYPGLYIEMKRKTGYINKKQAEWINALRSEGNYAVVCYGYDEAVEMLEWYLGGRMG